jgi:endonuclease YncB( thermonuclease family)
MDDAPGTTTVGRGDKMSKAVRGARFTALAFLFVLGLFGHARAAVLAIDGDTLEVDGVAMRVVDLDTPELLGKCVYERAKAREALGQASTLLRRYRRSTLVVRTGKLDRYRRPLINVYLGTGRTSFSSMMIVGGYGRPYGTGRKPWC